jgi:hypothetical protein
MNQINHIVAIWEVLDASLEQERVEAENAKDAKRAERILDRQRINDHAYFLLCFAQLETHIRKGAETLVNNRRDRTEWSERRSWETYNPGRLRFDQALMLVADRAGHTYRRIIGYYETRNLAAHGGFGAARIEVGMVAADFQMLAGRLNFT